MKKATVNMSEWELYIYNGEYNLSGIADNHPTIGRNQFVGYTSSLQRFDFENDVLTYETRNTIYICPLKYMQTKPYFNVVTEYKEKLMKQDNVSDSILDKIIAASARLALEKELNDDFVQHILEVTKDGKAELEAMKIADDNRMIEIAKKYEDCIYIEISNVDAGDKLAYHFGDHVGTIDPEIHSGMFQDSILYMKYAETEDDEELDFRYFPKGLGVYMETYSWSDNIKHAVIKNICDFVIVFNNEEVASGETKVFTPENHVEGLFRPDCYNGKSVFRIEEDDTGFDDTSKRLNK